MKNLVRSALFVCFCLVMGPGPAAQAQGSDPVRLVLPHRVLFDIALPYYVAEEKGFYSKAGIKVTPIFARGGGDQVQIVVAGDADIAQGTGLLASFSALERGAPLKIVSAEQTGMGDVFWYVKSDSPVKKSEDLTGKKMGFSNPGSSSHLAALAFADWLNAKGIKPPELISGGSFPEQFTAVMTSQIDAGWSAPPFFLEEAKKGTTRIVVGGNDIPGLSEITMRVNLARTEFLKARPDAARAFLRANKEALDFIFSQPDEAAKIWAKGAKLKEPPEVIKESWKFYSAKSLALEPIVGIERSIADAVRFKFLKKPFTPEDLKRHIDLSYIQK